MYTNCDETITQVQHHPASSQGRQKYRVIWMTFDAFIKKKQYILPAEICKFLFKGTIGTLCYWWHLFLSKDEKGFPASKPKRNVKN